MPWKGSTLIQSFAKPFTEIEQAASFRLNGTLENVRLALTGDVMETEFVTDNLIVEHGYSMTVQSVRVPIGSLISLREAYSYETAEFHLCRRALIESSEWNGRPQAR